MEFNTQNWTWEAEMDERRLGTRFPKEADADSAVVWRQPGQEQLVTVHDESLQGICLVVRDVSEYKVGTTATIVYHAEVMDGTVRRIEHRPDGEFLVAFECSSDRVHGRSSPPPAEVVSHRQNSI